MRVVLGFLSLLSLMLPVGVVGCDSPPDAPSDLETLLGYLFEHMDDDDPEALSAGLENLHAWFQDDAQLQRARAGFMIDTLAESAVSNLDDRMRSGDGLEGIAVATKSPFCSRSIASLLTWDDFGQLLDNFEFYNRSFDSDPSCFGDRNCLRVSGANHGKSAWAGVVGMETRYTVQYRWIETSVGWMMLQRFWLLEPVDGDKFGVKMNANYYIGIIMDDGGRAAAPISPAFRRAANGQIGRSGRDIDSAQEALSNAGSLRVHANWFNVDTGSIPIPDASIRNTLIQNQINDSERHDSWLTGHPEMVDCPSAGPGDGRAGGARADDDAVTAGAMTLNESANGGLMSPSGGSPVAFAGSDAQPSVAGMVAGADKMPIAGMVEAEVADPSAGMVAGQGEMSGAQGTPPTAGALGVDSMSSVGFATAGQSGSNDLGTAGMTVSSEQHLGRGGSMVTGGASQ